MKYYDQLVERMTSYYCSLAGCTPDRASDVMIRLRVLASQLDAYCQEAEEAARQAFPATAAGEALERHAALRGLVRKEGARAVGVVAFRRSTPAGYPILIPAGTVVQSGGPEAMLFTTVQDVTMGASFTSVIVQVQAAEPGSQYNLKNGSITVMVTPPPGITQLAQITACQGGTDPETDEELRARLLAACRNPAVGGSPGFYQSLALAQPEVGKARVLPVKRGGGTLDVVVYGSAGGLGANRVAALQELFAGQRELGIDVLVREAETIPVELEVSIQVREGWDYDTVASACRQAFIREMAALEIGESFPRARVFQMIMSQQGVQNCTVTLPAGDTTPGEDQLLVDGYVTVNKMEGQA